MSKSEMYNNTKFPEVLIREIAEKIFDFIAVISVTAGKIIFVNEMGARLFGYDNSNELIDKRVSDLRENIPDQKAFNTIETNIYTKEEFYEIIEFVSKSGKLFWGQLQFTSFFADGEVYRILQIEKSDNTKLHTETLLKERQRFGALMDYASIGVLILNQDFRIVLMNNSTLHLFGYTKRELRGSHIEALIPTSYQKRYKLFLLNYFSNPEDHSTEFRMELMAVTKEGTQFPVDISIGKFSTDKENFAILFINDITIRKKDEDEITNLNAQLEIKVNERTDELDATIARLEEQIKETKKTKAELLKVTQYQKAVLDSSGAMIIATDQNGTITLFNKAAEDLLGYKASEVIGKCNPSLFHDDNETQKTALRFSKELKKEITPGFEVYVAKSRYNLPNKNEWTFLKKDGSAFPVSLSTTAFRNSLNEITGFLGVAVDISETKKTEDELKKALDWERELNEMKSRFVSIASHEFRTPLSTILSSTYLLQKYVQLEEQPKREKHISRIISSVTQLTDMLEDLLNVGKIEEGKVSPKFSSLNIQQHIENNIEEIKSLLKKGQEIIFNHTGTEQVWLDPSMLSHIVINLLSNAIKFSPDNTPILIDTKISGSSLEIVVKDQGMGIPKQDLPHLFERFYRSKQAADIQGTGLGLYIAQKYTELMNGKIECRSEPEKGTEFIIKMEIRPL